MHMAKALLFTVCSLSAVCSVVGFLPIPSLVSTAAPALQRAQQQQSCLSSHARSGILSLRAQEGRQTGLGWQGRLPTSLQDSAAPSTRSKEMLVSSTGEIEIDGHVLMYDYLPGDGPTVFFLPALNQTRHGTKASTLKSWCRRTGRSFFVADYYGMGKSSGDYKDATISRWAKDTTALVKWLDTEKSQEKVILVGAGVGGWVMLHSASRQQEMRSPIVGLVGVAADPDFTETLVWPALDEPTREKIMKDGIAEIEWGGKPYTMTKNLIEDGRKMLLLDKGPNSINVECPVRLIQGLGDEEIPPESALKLSDCLKGRDVVITYVKYGRHGLEEYEDDFKRIYFAIEDIERSDLKAGLFRSMNRPV